MTGWKRYLIAVVAGLAGSVAWGFVVGFIGSSSSWGGIGAVVIGVAALAWAIEK